MYRFMNHVRLDDHKLTVSLILYAWMSLELSGPGKSVACEGPHGLVSGKWGSLRSNPHLIPDPSMGTFLLITLPWFMIVSIAFAGETSDKGTCRIIPHWSFDLFHPEKKIEYICKVMWNMQCIKIILVTTKNYARNLSDELNIWTSI